jgi:hypothetical protein
MLKPMKPMVFATLTSTVDVTMKDLGDAGHHRR